MNIKVKKIQKTTYITTLFLVVNELVFYVSHLSKSLIYKRNEYSCKDSVILNKIKHF